MYGFQDLIFMLDAVGVVDVILPFILIFAIVFAVLEKTKILGKEDHQVRKYATIIALVLAFAVIIPHVTGSYYYGFDAVEIINKALPGVGLLLVAIVMMLLTIGLWTGKAPDGSKGMGVWFTMISGLIVIAIFIGSIGWWQVPYWVWGILNSSFIPFVIAILVFGLIIKFIAGPSQSESEKSKSKSTGKLLEEFLAGRDDKK